MLGLGLRHIVHLVVSHLEDPRVGACVPGRSVTSKPMATAEADGLCLRDTFN